MLARSRAGQEPPARRPDRILASVIIPVYNGAATLDRCLQAISTQTVAQDTYEVIVVDDGSNDGSAELAAGHSICYIVARQQHLGAAAARNHGARMAQGDLLLFTDADCEPLPDWIARMTAPFTDSCVVGAKGVYRTRQRSLVARFAQAEFQEKYDRLNKAAPSIDFVDTYSAAYRRSVFEAQGGFDSTFMLDEDQELSFRMSESGHKLVFVPDAAVFHQHPDSVWGYYIRKARLAYWKVPVHLRYPAKALRDSYTPASQKTQLVLLPLLLAAALCWVLGGLPWIAPVSLAALGLLTTVPLVFRATRQGWDVAAIAPLMVLVRATALSAGIICGVLHLFTPRRRTQRSLASSLEREVR